MRNLIILLLICFFYGGSVYSQKVNPKKFVTIALAGDIMMGTDFPSDDYLPKNGGRDLFADAAPFIKKADCAFANLEGTLFDDSCAIKKCAVPESCYIFRTPVSYATHLADAGFDALSIANNHVNDFGLEGRLSTMRALKEHGLSYSGQYGYCETAVFRRNGVVYGFCAFGHSVNTPNLNDLDRVKKIVGKLRPKCDILVVSFHGGAEGSNYSRVPMEEEIFLGERRGDVSKFAHTCVDAGADIVYGHGPHIARALELYKGHIIAYSLGNFCTPYRFSIKGLLGCAPLLVVNVNKSNGRFISGKIHSFKQYKGVGPRADKTCEVAEHIRQLSLLDFPDSKWVITESGGISLVKQP